MRYINLLTKTTKMIANFTTLFQITIIYLLLFTLHKFLQNFKIKGFLLIPVKSSKKDFFNNL